MPNISDFMTPHELLANAFPALGLPLSLNNQTHALDAWILRHLRADARRTWRYKLAWEQDEYLIAKAYERAHVRANHAKLAQVANLGVEWVRVNAGAVTYVQLKADSIGRAEGFNVATPGLAEVLGELLFRYQWPVEGGVNGRKAGV
jgi:hypothetical protein